MAEKIKNFYKKVPKWLKITFVLMIILTLIFFGVIYFTTKSQTSEQLSDRSKEYLKSQQGRNESLFDNFDIDGKKSKKQTDLGNIDIPDCFRLSVPFPVKEKRSRDKCFIQLLLQDPRGFVVVYNRVLENPNIEEVSDIQIRKTNPQKYSEKITQISNQTYYIYKKEDQNDYEKIGFTIDPKGRLFVISLSANTNENLDPKFDTILESIKFGD